MAPALLRLLVTASVVTYGITTPWRTRNPHGATCRSRDAHFPASAPGPRPLLPPMAHLSGALHDGHQEIGIFHQFPWNRPFNFTVPKPAQPKNSPWWIILRVFFPGIVIFGLLRCCCCNRQRDLETSTPSLLELESRSQDQSHAPAGQAAELQAAAVAYTTIVMPYADALPAPSAESRHQPAGDDRGGVSQDAVLPPPARDIGKI